MSINFGKAGRWLHSAFSVILVMAPCGVGAQAVDSRPRFEVASLKTAAVPTGFDNAANRRDPGRIVFNKSSLLSLTLWAYGIKPYQIIAPGWWTSTFYDLEATFPPGAAKDSAPLMLQVLLEERLHLRVHRGTAEMPVYAVATAKELRIHKVENSPESEGIDGGAQKPVSKAYFTASERRFEGTISIPALLIALGRGLDRPLVDMTGLQGKYQIKLTWTPADMPLTGMLPPGGGADSVSSVSLPSGEEGSLFSAMEKQLGLKVESRKAPIEMLVIDHVERVPTGN